LEHAADGRKGLAALERGVFDAVLLDVMMPGLDGLEVCRRIRERSRLPVIMLTARGDETDRVVGLELGADDYVPKPFSPRELLARLRAVLRRTAPAGEPPLVVGNVSVDLGARAGRVGGGAGEMVPGMVGRGCGHWLRAVLAAGTVLWLISGKIAFTIARPLHELLRVTEEIGAGKLSARAEIPPWRMGEMSYIASAINDMA